MWKDKIEQTVTTRKHASWKVVWLGSTLMFCYILYLNGLTQILWYEFIENGLCSETVKNEIANKKS